MPNLRNCSNGDSNLGTLYCILPLSCRAICLMQKMVICFTPDENVRNSIPSIVIDGNIVETVEYAKLLGVTLSNDLSWNRHVDCIVKKRLPNECICYIS